jgi:hypothetical protein
MLQGKPLQVHQATICDFAAPTQVQMLQGKSLQVNQRTICDCPAHTQA